jgi:MinD superfamily P-loop ATPase
MEIAVASGKGGVGKTTVSVTLASFYKDKGFDVALLDCDVEEPNVNLFLGAQINAEEKSGVYIPSVDTEKCTGCGKCSDLCEYSAIVLIKAKPLVLPLMCHSCGGCALVCPEDAITEVWREIGFVETGDAAAVKYAGGRLNIGEPMSPPLIKEVKNRYSEAAIRIIDSPPGTSCPVIESVRDADFILLVAEPTRFGLNDLELAAGMAAALGVPYGVVLNRAVSGRDMVKDFCSKRNIPLIAEIPEEREIAVAYSNGDCVSFIRNNYAPELEKIAKHIENNSRGKQ